MSPVWLLAAALPLRLPPIDDCRGDPGFDRFRTELSVAIAKHDGEALTALASDDVRLSFGGRGGRETLRQMIGRDGSEATALWAALQDVMSLGCAVKGKARVFPSMFVQGGDYDGFTTWVARPGARLRSAPRPKASVRARLSWDVVTDDETMNGGDWIGVRTAKGRRGYVHRSAARSLIGYRLFAEPRGDGWRMTAFVAGD